MDECYEDLANAIVLQAVSDYRRAIKELKKDPNCQYKISGDTWYHGKRVKREVLKFFRSSWFEYLTSVNAEMLIKKLEEAS